MKRPLFLCPERIANCEPVIVNRREMQKQGGSAIFRRKKRAPKLSGRILPGF